jgi:hypothetical protein
MHRSHSSHRPTPDSSSSGILEAVPSFPEVVLDFWKWNFGFPSRSSFLEPQKSPKGCGKSETASKNAPIRPLLDFYKQFPVFWNAETRRSASKKTKRLPDPLALVPKRSLGTRGATSRPALHLSGAHEKLAVAATVAVGRWGCGRIWGTRGPRKFPPTTRRTTTRQQRPSRLCKKSEMRT